MKPLGNIKINNSINTIKEIEVNGQKINDQTIIGDKLLDYYTTLYKEDSEVTLLNS